MFASLEVPNYRRHFIGTLVSASGTWMQSTGQTWLLLRVLNQRGTVVGLIVAMQFLPMLVAGPYGGLIADRFDKRRILLVTQVLYALVTGGLAIVTLTGHVHVWVVFVTAALGGSVSVIDVPTRQSFASELVGAELLPNAVGLSSSVNNAARAVGPAIAGIIIATTHNPGWCFGYNSFTYLVALVAISRMDANGLQRSKPVVRAKGQVRAGLAYVRANADLGAAMVVIAIVGTCSLNFLTLMPLLANNTFRASAATFGALSSALGVGSLMGALAVARHGRSSMRLVVAAAAALGVMMLAVAAAPVIWIALVALVVCGFAMTGFLASANTFLQLRAAPEMRGRVMSLYSLVIIGSSPIGGPLLALLSEKTDARVGFAFGGSVALLVAIVTVARRPGLIRPTTSVESSR